MNFPFLRPILLFLVLTVFGCFPSQQTTTTSVPYDTLAVATLNLGKLTRRIENTDVAQLARVVERENIRLLALVGVTRYPQVKTRTDLVEELAKRRGMYSAFGESAMLSGQQTGNALLTLYPITSQKTTQYEGLQSKTFESALQATVDCGLRSVVIIGTHIPENASDIDQKRCADTLASLRAQYANEAVIVAGNLPTAVNPTGGYVAARFDESDLSFWYSGDGALRVLSHKVVRTPLGTVLIAHFEVFRPLPL